MTQNALVASHHYVVTAIPDHLSTIGLNILRNKTERIADMVESAKLAGRTESGFRMARFGAVLFVRVRIGGSLLTSAHAAKMEEVRGRHECFDTHTTELIGYTEAAEHCLPVWLHKAAQDRQCTTCREQERMPADCR